MVVAAFLIFADLSSRVKTLPNSETIVSFLSIPFIDVHGAKKNISKKRPLNRRSLHCAFAPVEMTKEREGSSGESSC
jgi:hypothetical protein